MLHRARPLGPLSQRRFFLQEVNDMSNHAVSFESNQIGATPEGWTVTLTGKGDSKWTVESDETAPSKLKVVKQSGRATYPLLLKNDTNIKDGFIALKFKAIGGSQDRAAGVAKGDGGSLAVELAERHTGPADVGRRPVGQQPGLKDLGRHGQ